MMARSGSCGIWQRRVRPSSRPRWAGRVFSADCISAAGLRGRPGGFGFGRSAGGVTAAREGFDLAVVRHCVVCACVVVPMTADAVREVNLGQRVGAAQA